LSPAFLTHIEAVAKKFGQLLHSRPIHFPLGASAVPEKGVYLFSESSDYLYVGRSDSIRDRLNTHQRNSALVNQAAFASILAKQGCGLKNMPYTQVAPGKHFSEKPKFRKAFSNAKQRIRKMDIRVVEEADPVTQALLEIYVAVTLPTRYNDFANH